MNLIFIFSLLAVQCLLGFKALPSVLFPVPDNYSVAAAFLVFVPTFWFYFSQRGFRAFVFSGLSLIAVYLGPGLFAISLNDPNGHGYYLFLAGMLMGFTFGGCFGLLQTFLHRFFRWESVLLFPLTLGTFFFLLTTLAPLWGFLPSPSLSPASALVIFPPLIQMASFTGVFGVDFLILFVASVLAFVAWETALRWPWLRTALGIGEELKPLPNQKWLIAGSLALAVLLGLGGLFLAGNIEARKLAQAQKESKKNLTVALIQPNLTMVNGLFIRSVKEDSFITQYRKLMSEATRQGADLMVFPENIWDGNLPLENHFWQRFRGLIREVKCYTVAGMITQLENDPKLYNVWYLIGQQGEILDSYKKRYLIAFGEYIPNRPFMENMLKLLNHFLDRSYQIFKIRALASPTLDVSPGTSEKVFAQGQARYFVKICSELEFPGYAVEGVRAGGEAIFSPATGEWFRTPLYTRIFFAQACFRAVETRRWVGRNTSYANAFFVDAQGCLRNSSPFNRRAVLVQKISLIDYRTFYVRFGDLFGWCSAILVLGSILWALGCVLLPRAFKPKPKLEI